MAFNSGSKLRASDLNVTLLARKTVDQSISSNTTPQNDTVLFADLSASTSWEVLVHCIYTAAATPQINVGFVGPTGATLDWVANGLGSGVTGVDQGSTSWKANTIGSANVKTLGCDSASIPVVGRLSGLLVMSSTAGRLNFVWCQAVSGGTATTVKAGSYMILRRVA